MKTRLLICLLFISLKSVGQDYSSFKNIISQLRQYSIISDSAQRASEIEKWFAALRQQNQIPFIVEDSVAFLYQGEAKSVSWSGDFNGWGYDKAFQNKGVQIPNTNIWMLKSASPKMRVSITKSC